MNVLLFVGKNQQWRECYIRFADADSSKLWIFDEENVKSLFLLFTTLFKITPSFFVSLINSLNSYNIGYISRILARK